MRLGQPRRGEMREGTFSSVSGDGMGLWFVSIDTRESVCKLQQKEIPPYQLAGSPCHDPTTHSAQLTSTLENH